MRHGILLCILLAAPGLLSAGRITGPAVVSDNWPSCIDLKTWADDVIRIEGLTTASDRDKALALYEWSRVFVMGGVVGQEGPYGAETLTWDLHKIYFVYGNGFCAHKGRGFEGVWCAYKQDNTVGRRINCVAFGHTMAELYWGGSWHGFDLLHAYYFLASDSPTANVLSYEQIVADNVGNGSAVIRANQGWTNRAYPFYERPTSFNDADVTNDMPRTLALDGWLQPGQSHNVDFNYSNPNSQTWHDMRYTIPRGMVITREWDSGSMFYEPPTLASQLGSQGRHNRVTTTSYGGQWPDDDPLFSLSEPYLKTCTDSSESYFYGQDTVFFSTGTITWTADLWSDRYQDAVTGTPGMVRAATAPYLRPNAAGGSRSIIFSFYTPYICSDGRIEGMLTAGDGDAAAVAFSTDSGATWETVVTAAGPFNVNIGKTLFNANHQSVTGKYAFQVRVQATAATDPASVGLCSLTVHATIDGSLFSLPRLTAGSNTVRFKVDSQAAVTDPIKVTYNWENASATPFSNAHTITPADFSANETSWTVSAPGLYKCVDYSVAYAPVDADEDGLPDSWETALLGSTGFGDTDTDGDGLLNSQEYAAGTDPGSSDTDGDGLDDGADPDPLHADASGGLTVTTASLPAGTVGASYSTILTAAGGVPPCTWAVTSGSLPDGLTLGSVTGAITGTPTAVGSTAFTVQATDSASTTAQRSLTILISDTSVDAGTESGCLPGSEATAWPLLLIGIQGLILLHNRLR